MKLGKCEKDEIGTATTACWGDFNSKELPCQKFLQNPFLGCQWSVLEGKWIICTVEAIYLMIWAKFKGRNCQSIGKLLREISFWNFYVVASTVQKFLFPSKTVHWHPRNGFWKNFSNDNCFELKSPQHAVKPLFIQ